MSQSPFMQVKVQTPDSNVFDLSHDNKLSLDMGGLYPVLTMETIPGDRFSITPQALVRFAPMVFPVMHRIDVYIHFFYVPIRTMWDNWGKFLAGETVAHPYIQGTDTTPTLPVATGQLLDYLGLPSVSNIKTKLSPFPIIAYYFICNQYYQDQNNSAFYVTVRDVLQALKTKNGLLLPTDFFSGTDDEYQFSLTLRCWEHDRFTSALPFSQKGPSVSIPVTLNDLPVEVYEVLGLTSDVPPTIDGTLKNLVGVAYTDDGVNPPEAIKMAGLADGSGASIEGTINQLRVSYALQRYYELNARAGTRYPELIKGRWGIDIGDSTLSRPEYIGGVKNNVVISEVLQTSATTPAENALGEYAGHGTGLLDGNTLSYTCTEQGFVMGIMSVLPKTAYFQGIDKMWTRFTPTDYPQPEFFHLGEQAVLNKEVYYDPALTDNDDEFGYMPMGYELKQLNSGLHGQFRTDFLPFTLAREFSNRPVLNDEFVMAEVSNRIFAVQDPDFQNLYAHVYFDIKANRKIPYYSTPV